MRPATDAERKALGIPPAYTDVMIAEDPKADLVATARIPKTGKQFYRYSKAFVERQADKKWIRVRRLGQKVEKVEARILRDCRSGPDRDVAMCARLILLTGLRNGGDPQGEGESYGASSLLLKHVTIDGDSIRLQFPGKKGVQQDHIVTDELLAGYVRERSSELQPRSSPLFPHDAGATLRYMKSVGAEKVHDIRTWRANILAQALVEEILKAGKPTTQKEVKKIQKIISGAVSKVLGNSVSQAFKSYIDPRTWSPLE